jgi:hypothetical protein
VQHWPVEHEASDVQLAVIVVVLLCRIRWRLMVLAAVVLTRATTIRIFFNIVVDLFAILFYILLCFLKSELYSTPFLNQRLLMRG